MKRAIDISLKEWANTPQHKPLILRGARQVGKTNAVRRLGEQFELFLEINLEAKPDYHAAFAGDFNAKRIIRDLSLMANYPIIPGKTLLFLDEIQSMPSAITALRYFYEELPELHVIAAGSLLDFAIEKIGVPVGRVTFLQLYPMSFLEFLAATQRDMMITAIMQQTPDQPLTPVIHHQFLKILGEYFAVGGMPEVVNCWRQTNDLRQCAELLQQLTMAYRQDFQKYAKASDIKYIDLLFANCPQQIGKKFKYANISKEHRSRELGPSLELLCKAGIVHKIYHSDGQSLPLGAQINNNKFKIIFLDIALTQAILGLEIKDWLLSPHENFINKGQIVEAFVGQELLAYGNPKQNQQLFYWHREAKNSNAEIDYLISQQQEIIPVEVKSGKGGSLGSLHQFKESHPLSTRALRFSAQNYSVFENIFSYPLYAIAKALGVTAESS